MDIKPYQPRPSIKTLEDIMSCVDNCSRELSEIMPGNWSCDVYEIDDNGDTGTLIYVPSVPANELFKQGGN